MWLVTEGSYSDETPVCVCDTKDQADAIVAFVTENVYGINEPREIEVRTDPPAIWPELRINWIFDPDTGDEWGPVESRLDGYGWGDNPGPLAQHSVVLAYAGCINAYGKPMDRKEGRLELIVSGSDFDRVRKVASEQMARIKAEGLVDREAMMAKRA